MGALLRSSVFFIHRLPVEKEHRKVSNDPTIEIFCCYAHEDLEWMSKLKTHLLSLTPRGQIIIWSSIDINAGDEWAREIKKHLDAAHIILLLISPDFIASDYCYSTQLEHAIARHEEGKACVIPIIFRPTHWKKTLFAKLQVVPEKGKGLPISEWSSQDAAFYDVINSIQDASHIGHVAGTCGEFTPTAQQNCQ